MVTVGREDRQGPTTTDVFLLYHLGYCLSPSRRRNSRRDQKRRLTLLAADVFVSIQGPSTLWGVPSFVMFCKVFCTCSTIRWADTTAIVQPNDGRLLVCGLVKRPGKARPNRLSNGRLEFHQTTYQKPSAIGNQNFQKQIN